MIMVAMGRWIMVKVARGNIIVTVVAGQGVVT